MRIADVKVIVTSPGRNFATVKITTDDGTTGVGDATLNGRELAVAEGDDGKAADFTSATTWKTLRQELGKGASDPGVLQGAKHVGLIHLNDGDGALEVPPLVAHFQQAVQQSQRFGPPGCSNPVLTVLSHDTLDVPLVHHEQSLNEELS